MKSLNASLNNFCFCFLQIFQKHSQIYRLTDSLTDGKASLVDDRLNSLLRIYTEETDLKQFDATNSLKTKKFEDKIKHEHKSKYWIKWIDLKYQMNILKVNNKEPSL